MSLDKEKQLPESEKKETGTEKIKKTVQQDILDLSKDEDLQKMKDRYGETEDSFVKGMRGNEEFAKKCQNMTDKEVIEFSKSDPDLRQYYARIIDKKSNKPKEDKKPDSAPKEDSKPKENKPREDKVEKQDNGSDKKENPKENKPEEPKKIPTAPESETKPIEKPAEPQKTPDKKPDDKPKEKKKHFRSNRFKKKDKKPDDKPQEKKPGFFSKIGSGIGKGIKAIPHQTWNAVSYAPRVARSTVKYVGFDWINHGLNKPGLKKNRDNYASKWKWEQTAKQK